MTSIPGVRSAAASGRIMNGTRSSISCRPSASASYTPHSAVTYAAQFTRARRAASFSAAPVSTGRGTVERWSEIANSRSESVPTAWPRASPDPNTSAQGSGVSADTAAPPASSPATARSFSPPATAAQSPNHAGTGSVPSRCAV
ncbi:hypothetical protein GCM10009836_03810 [Pseudonocardia ailaonensis]|uniref:Uncharacterized protein n=1 Tax=Pseudonocardia ailaonensis TaxID=367279 RepID=A0ABN2MKK4_9PSEU